MKQTLDTLIERPRVRGLISLATLVGWIATSIFLGGHLSAEYTQVREETAQNSARLEELNERLHELTTQLEVLNARLQYLDPEAGDSS